MASENIVKLNIGGEIFQATRSTLTKYDGFFRDLFESGIPPTLDGFGCIFIDRPSEHFNVILNFLRDSNTSIPESELDRFQLLTEAEYYRLDELILLCGGASENIVKLNIGGEIFQATRSTLTKYDGFFRDLFESGIPPTLDGFGCIFIDRPSEHFNVILNFLRDDNTSIPESKLDRFQLLTEAEYYRLDELILLCGGASENIVKLNIGGEIFQATRSTLTKYDGFFRDLFESGIPPTLDGFGCIFIDRPSEHFNVILNFLRDGNTSIPESELDRFQLLTEAEYYSLDGLIHLCGGEPSEEWKRVNLDKQHLRDWRRANLKAEIQFSSNDEEHEDFSRYCKDKLAIKISYSVPFWGDIHENPSISKFVKKYSGTWNILFIPLIRWPKFYIRRSNESISTRSLNYQATCEELLKEVEEKMKECS